MTSSRVMSRNWLPLKVALPACLRLSSLTSSTFLWKISRRAEYSPGAWDLPYCLRYASKSSACASPPEGAGMPWPAWRKCLSWRETSARTGDLQAAGRSNSSLPGAAARKVRKSMVYSSVCESKILWRACMCQRTGFPSTGSKKKERLSSMVPVLPCACEAVNFWHMMPLTFS